MIKLGKLTDYAIVVMGQLSREGADAARSAHYLSDMTGLPEPTVAKVLKRLAQAGLVESLRGAARQAVIVCRGLRQTLPRLT